MDEKVDDLSRKSELKPIPIIKPNDGIGFSPLLVIWLFSILVLLYYYFLITNWSFIIRIFEKFEDSNTIISNFYSVVANSFSHVILTDIAIIMAFILGILYLIISIESSGHMIFSKERKDVNAQNATIAILIIAVFNAFFLLPFCWYLFFEVHHLGEGIIDVFLFILSLLFVSLFSGFVKIMQNYFLLNEFCKNIRPNRIILPFNRTDSLLILINNKTKFRDISIVLMIVAILLAYIWNVNLLSLGYTELILFFWMIIILMLNFPGGPIKGPVNIILENNTVLNRVFIIEESENYIMTLHKEMTIHNENVVKKIMTSSIVYIEPSDLKTDN